jgi:SAM-dependent methyltransferase
MTRMNLAELKRRLREHPYSQRAYLGLAELWLRFRVRVYVVLNGRYYNGARLDRIFTTTPDPWGYSGNQISERRRQLILEILPLRRFQSLLEIGCAAGWMTSALENRADKIVAIDISHVALDHARARCRGFSNIQFARLDILTEPLPGVFDCIICAGVLPYVPAKAQNPVRDRLLASLAAGGHLVLEQRTESSPGELSGSEIESHYRNHPQLSTLRRLEIDEYAITLFRKVSS